MLHQFRPVNIQYMWTICRFQCSDRAVDAADMSAAQTERKFWQSQPLQMPIITLLRIRWSEFKYRLVRTAGCDYACCPNMRIRPDIHNTSIRVGGSSHNITGLCGKTTALQPPPKLRDCCSSRSALTRHQTVCHQPERRSHSVRDCNIR